MMAALNRAVGSKRPRVTRSSGTLELGFSDAWQDALDPDLPAEPASGIRHAASSLVGQRPSAHKLILMGLVLGAGLQALGYFGAAYWF